jgi:uncharacterized protein YdcH (DUF465 family)
VGLSTLLNFFSKYGLAGVFIAILLFAVGVMYLQLMQNLKDANARADRFEAEVKSLNDEIQKYLALGIAARTVMGEAANEMRKLQ